jgi:serine/threonine protein kinase
MQPATRFGPYEIIRRLGKSMNDVYLARDTRENRQAALKLIKSGPDAVSQLILEAERRGAAIQQRLRTLDPRVIEVYDYGDLDGYFYVAMQYVEGRSLAEVLKHDGRMSAYRAAHVAMEICGQLDKFHAFRPGDGVASSVVHGDIKPSNIHLGLNETVRLLDFGIAKTLRPDCDFTFHNFGSPSYCSPERLGRSLLDQQADLWALGVTLYEMLAGSPPYQAENTRKLERLIQSGRPPRALPASCPAPLKAVIGKALAPAVERRYQSAAAFGDDLKAFLEGAETAAGKEKRSAWKPNPTVESGQASKPKRARRPPPLRSPLRMAGRIAGALGCVLAGMLLFIGTSYCSRYWRASRQLRANLDYARRPAPDLNTDWSLYTDMQAQFGFLGRYSPVERLRAPLRTAYAQAGAQVLDGYARSSDPDLRHFDWEKAELCLTRAMDLGASGQEVAGKLALARGYVALRQSQRENGRERFLEAARYIPQSPDPHLGLARADLLASLPGDALAELSAAERLGYRLGPREMEQRAEAYRLRGFEELQAGNVTAARQDFAAAGHPIPAPAPPNAARKPVHRPRSRRWR